MGDKIPQSLNEYMYKKEVFSKLDKLELEENAAVTSTLRNPKYSTLSSNTMTYREGTKTSKKDSHLHPLQSSEVVEPMKIDPASLLVTEHKDILYKQKTKDKEFMLK